MHTEIAKQIIPECDPQLLINGLTNINFHLTFPNSQQPDSFLTIYPSKTDWWKIKKDHIVETHLDRQSIPHARRISFGVKEVDQRPIAFLEKNFIHGANLDDYLQIDGLPLQAVERIMGQLGDSLGRMHSVIFDKFGWIRNGYIAGSEFKRMTPPATRWVDFMDTMMTAREELVTQVPASFSVGRISGKEIKNAYDKSRQFYEKKRGLFETIIQPRLTHNDMRFANVMVSSSLRNADLWNISGIVDLEACLAGDPDLDLAQMENWLQFVGYYGNKTRKGLAIFMDAYKEHRTIPDNYSDKKEMYGIIRSLSYLLAVSSLNPDSEILKDSRTEEYFQRYYEMLQTALGF